LHNWENISPRFIKHYRSLSLACEKLMRERIQEEDEHVEVDIVNRNEYAINYIPY
jgi:hypothetical protein